ncbi:Ig-like domain-containing protein [Pyrinomonas sp.]|uniref:Ig-like domain-containing protein n=1 Tax=Pyrinomonas sp. TaxID=2080306 RepID=UPI00331AA14C
MAFLVGAIFALHQAILWTGSVAAQASMPQVVISQVYGGGGNSGATYKNDFIEIFNRGATAVNLNGWSVQYASSTGTTWQVTTLSGTLQPGQYYLIRQAAGGGGTVDLPPPDATGNIAMSATSGKVALVNSTSALTGACPTANIVDFVGYGSTANCFEGAGPTVNLSNTTAAIRAGNGCTDTNNNNADFSAGAPTPRNTNSPLNPCGGAPTPSPSPSPSPPTITPIHTIQGTGSSSPLVGQTVTTSGIVTGLKSNGFFIQAPDSEADNDPNSSEGIFVFTASAPPSAATIGNRVNVTGTVTEFRPSSDPNSPPLTQISNSPTVTVVSTNNPLPTPITLTPADTSPTGTVEQLEKYEGMRVRVDSLLVIGPTGGTVNETTATSVSNGIFYGVVLGLARPFREPGISVLDPLPAGAPCCVPRFDANPEKLRIDSDAQPGAVALNVTAGSIVSNIVGPLDFGFRTYTILPDAATPPSVSNVGSAIAVPEPTADEFTVGSFNMERFFDATDDPAINEPVLTPMAFNNRLNKASLAIRQVMRSPDIIGVQEVENLATLQAVANKLNDDEVAAGRPNPNYQAFLIEGNDQGGIDVGFLVKTNRVEVIEVRQEGKNATYINPITNQPELLNDRPPLVLRARVRRDGTDLGLGVTVIVNHLRSLLGINDPTGGQRVRAKRRAQAEFLANLLQSLQTSTPTEPVISVGDYNAFQFNDGYVDVIGTVRGQPTPPDQVVLASSDLVEPDFVDLVDQLPASERYSFVNNGDAQVLDHIIVNQAAFGRFNRFAYARNDADFPETFRNDATRPERISDHDMPVAYFALPPVNRAPIARDQSVAVVYATPLTFALEASDPDGDALSFALVSAPTKGNVAFDSSNRTATYTPNPGASGADSFTYRATDPHGASAQATVSIAIVPEDVSSLVRATSSGLIYNRATRTYNGTITITNTSARAISGPLQVVLTGLSAGTTLVNASGVYNGDPYVTANIASLEPSGSVTVSVQFRSSSSARISYVTKTYAGIF